MAEYISREDVLDNSNIITVHTKEYGSIDVIPVDTIADIKLADVQPIIHARWIELPKALNPNENPCKCSNCGHILSFMNHYPKSNFCPNCGAKMLEKPNLQLLKDAVELIKKAKEIKVDGARMDGDKE